MDFLVAIKELGHIEAGLGFCEFGLDDFVHVWGTKFSYQVGVIFGSEDIIKGENTGFIFQFFENFNFRLEKNSIDLVFKHFKIDHFYSHWYIYR